jgi:hypothetical protein
MPSYALEIKVDIEGLAKLTPLENNVWQFDISSDSSGGGELKEGITVCALDELEIEGSRGHANYTMKWHGSKQHAYIKIIPLDKHISPGFYPIEKAGEYIKIAAFECRGLSLERYIPGADFSAEGSTGTIFPQVDLTDPDGWTDYDEGSDEAVSIMGLEHRIVRI